MSVRIDKTGAVLRLRFEGVDALDSVSAAQVRAETLARIQEPHHLVVDLSGIEFMDSAGVGVLVSIFKAARSRGLTIRLAGAHPNVRAILGVIKLDRIFDVHPDADELVKALAEAGT